MSSRFRNVDAQTSDPVATWPYEALVAVVDHGLVADWQPVFAEIRRSPWGETARRIERFLDYRDHDGVSTLFRLAIDRARYDHQDDDRRSVADRVRAAQRRSGLTADAFARLVGTSPSRFSTYATGRVVPSAAMLVRMERIADRHMRAQTQ